MSEDNPYEATPAVISDTAPAPASGDRSLLARMFVLWKRCFAPLAVLGIVAQLGTVPALLVSGGENIVEEPVALFKELLTGDTLNTAVALAGALLIQLPMSVVAAVASFLVIGATLRGQQIGPLQALRAANPMFWRYLRLHVLLSLMLAVLGAPMELTNQSDLFDESFSERIVSWEGGLLALSLIFAVAMAFLMCVWAAAYPVVVFEGRKAIQSLGRSARLTRGHRSTIFGAGIVLGLIAIGAAIPSFVVGELFSDELASQILFGFTYAVVPAPLTIAFFYAVYERLLKFDTDPGPSTGDSSIEGAEV